MIPGAPRLFIHKGDPQAVGHFFCEDEPDPWLGSAEFVRREGVGKNGDLMS